MKPHGHTHTRWETWRGITGSACPGHGSALQKQAAASQAHTPATCSDLPLAPTYARDVPGNLICNGQNLPWPKRLPIQGTNQLCCIYSMEHDSAIKSHNLLTLNKIITRVKECRHSPKTDSSWLIPFIYTFLKIQANLQWQKTNKQGSCLGQEETGGLGGVGGHVHHVDGGRSSSVQTRQNVPDVHLHHVNLKCVNSTSPTRKAVNPYKNQAMAKRSVPPPVSLPAQLPRTCTLSQQLQYYSRVYAPTPYLWIHKNTVLFTHAETLYKWYYLVHNLKHAFNQHDDLKFYSCWKIHAEFILSALAFTVWQLTVYSFTPWWQMFLSSFKLTISIKLTINTEHLN